MQNKLFGARQILTIRGLFVLCLLSLSACGTSDAVQEEIVLNENEAVVIAGFRIGTLRSLNGAGVVWSRFDPPSGNIEGDDAPSMVWRDNDCEAVGLDDSCVTAGYGRFAYRVAPGSYALDYVVVFRRSGSTDIRERTRFLPERTETTALTKELVEGYRRASPVFHVDAGEVIYLGDFLFLPKFEETKAAVLTRHAVYSYGLHRLSYDLDGAQVIARRYLPSGPEVQIRNLLNRSEIVIGESASD